MGRKVSDRTKKTAATLLGTEYVGLADEDAASTAIEVDELKQAFVRPAVVEESTTSRSLTEADDGAVILCTNAGAITIAVPDGLPLGFTCTIMRGDGAGALTIQGDGTILLETEGSAPGTGVTATVNTRGVASVVVHDDTSPDTARVFGGIS